MAVDQQSSEIIVVDDEAMVRDVWSDLLVDAGFRVLCFADGDSFAAAAPGLNPACVILDIHMPGRSGIELLKDIDAKNYPAPILVASGLGDIPKAVEAIKNGAFDFFEKPVDGDALVSRIREAIRAFLQRNNEDDGVLRSSFPGSELLTPREWEVLAQVAASATSKEAASNLGISARTVEIHRAHIMHKLGAKNSVDLARKVLGRKRYA